MQRSLVVPSPILWYVYVREICLFGTHAGDSPSITELLLTRSKTVNAAEDLVTSAEGLVNEVDADHNKVRILCCSVC